jgi:hypothetical protein
MGYFQLIPEKPIILRKYNGRDLIIHNSGRRGPLDKIIDSDDLEEE